jgi:hypothetical protein
MNHRKILIWEITGFVFISLLGSLLHFAFEFFGEWPPVALIAAVNESVWEHLKLAFWPALIYALIEWPYFRRHIKNFWTAKAIGILVMPLIIISLFYGYTGLAGHNVLWLDISLFVLAVLIGQMLSCRILLRPSFASGIKIPAMILVVLMIAAFSLLTFFPLHCPLFCDPRTGQYGILR